METYRLYQLKANHILAADTVEAADDGTALRYAQASIMFEAVEVWQGRRMVGLIANPMPNTPVTG